MGRVIPWTMARLMPMTLGYLQMTHSNGGYEIKHMAPYYDTAESIQRDFGKYTRETGAMAPLPHATHHSTQAFQPYNTQPPVMVNPYPPTVTSMCTTAGKSPIHLSVAQGKSLRLPRLQANHIRKRSPRRCPKSLEQSARMIMPKRRRELGINLAQRLSERPAIEKSDDKSGARRSRRQGQVSDFPFETRIRTCDGNITRGELLDELCSAVVEFVLMSKKEESANVFKEYARWKIGTRDLKADMFFITGLIHRGGNYFQPEIWVPRQSKNSER